MLTYSRLGCAKKIDPKFIATIKTGKYIKNILIVNILKLFYGFPNLTLNT